MLECPICHKKWNTSEELSKCLNSCIETQKRKKEEEKRKYLKAEKECRMEAIQQQAGKLETMINAYCKDYNESVQLVSSHGDRRDLPFLFRGLW